MTNRRANVVSVRSIIEAWKQRARRSRWRQLQRERERNNTMAKRREAREMAVQFLYQWDAGRNNLEEALTLFWGHFDEAPNAETQRFIETMVRGVVKNQTEIDAKIGQ